MSTEAMDPSKRSSVPQETPQAAPEPTAQQQAEQNEAARLQAQQEESDTQRQELESAWASESLSSDDLPDELGPDFAFFIKADYLRAKPHEDGEHYIVVEGVGDDRTVKKVPLDEFDTEYTVVPPNKLVGEARFETP